MLCSIAGWITGSSPRKNVECRFEMDSTRIQAKRSRDVCDIHSQLVEGGGYAEVIRAERVANVTAVQRPQSATDLPKVY